MDAARYAGMSDPDKNPNFRRRWDTPPLKSKRALMGGTIRRPEFEVISSELEIARIFANFKQIETECLCIGGSDAEF